jgi:carboxylesterase
LSEPSERYPVQPGAEAWSFAGTPGSPHEKVGLVLVHGFTGSPVSMRPLGELLAAKGFRVEVPRLPGHGTHARDMQHTRYADWRAEVARTVERLAKAAERVVLVGLSMGGTLALDVASSGEHAVASVVCINPQILDREGALVKLSSLIELLVPLAPASLAGLRKDDIAKPGVSERAYDWVPTASGNSLLKELPRVRSQLRNLSCPLLVAHSRQDHSVPPANSEQLLRLVPHARELVLERSYHVATLDYDLELLAARIGEQCDAPASER